jgi:hypothetical protein
MRAKYLVYFLFLITAKQLKSQNTDSTNTIKNTLDSLFIEEVEKVEFQKEKVLHAEPLYIDLIRDLGARKGEKEWNVGFGMVDNDNYDKYIALVEYEFAPIDRLGLEIELPFTFYNQNASGKETPQNKLDGLKLAAQWSFFVSTKLQTTLALGYLHEFGMPTFRRYGREPFYRDNLYNPFFVAAKRWGTNFHTLIYAGPVIEHDFRGKHSQTHAQINTNIHYMISGTRNFIGVEFNKEIYNDDFDMIIRPQLRVSVSENLLVGIVSGIPFDRESERFSSFVRIIYEPGHKHKKPLLDL